MSAELVAVAWRGRKERKGKWKGGEGKGAGKEWSEKGIGKENEGWRGKGGGRKGSRREK